MSERDEPPCICSIEALSYDECPAHPDDPDPEREAELRRRAAELQGEIGREEVAQAPDLPDPRAWAIVGALADRIQRLEMHLDSLIDATYPFIAHQHYFKGDDVVIPGRDLGHGDGIHPATGQDLDWLWRAQHAAHATLYPDAAIDAQGDLLACATEQPLGADDE